MSDLKLAATLALDVEDIKDVVQDIVIEAIQDVAAVEIEEAQVDITNDVEELTKKVEALEATLHKLTRQLSNPVFLAPAKGPLEGRSDFWATQEPDYPKS